MTTIKTSHTIKLPWEAQTASLLAAAARLVALPRELDATTDFDTLDLGAAFESLLRDSLGSGDMPGASSERELPATPPPTAAGLTALSRSRIAVPPVPLKSESTRAELESAPRSVIQSPASRAPATAEPLENRGPRLLSDMSQLPSLFDALVSESAGRETPEQARGIARRAAANPRSQQPLQASEARTPAVISDPATRSERASRAAPEAVPARPEPAVSPPKTAQAPRTAKPTSQPTAARERSLSAAELSAESNVRDVPAAPTLATAAPEPAQPSAAAPSLAPLDLAWEEALLERLLERWEARLREQSIRHLGFTGGRI